MAHSLSAQKRVRQSQEQAIRNKSVKTRVRHVISAYLKLAEEGDAKKLEATLPAAYKTLDQAWSKGVYKRNSINRYKSRLARVLAALRNAKPEKAAAAKPAKAKTTKAKAKPAKKD